MVLFDLHGEYGSAFGDHAEVISAIDLELPYWLMNSEELLGLMVDRAESAAPNQIAKFKELLQAAKQAVASNIDAGLDREHDLFVNLFKVPFMVYLNLINVSSLSLNAVLIPALLCGMASGAWARYAFET